jgi:hypothetical protein
VRNENSAIEQEGSVRSIFLMLVLSMAAAGEPAATIDQVTGETSLTTADYVEIQQLYARYNTAIDSGDGAGWAATFVSNGVFNTTTIGHDALVQFVRDWREKRNGANLRHSNTNLVVAPTPDGAKGTIYLALLNVSVRPAIIQSTGMYEDYLLKTPQGWKFKTRTVRIDPVPPKE